MPAQSSCNLTVQGHDGIPRILIHNPLDGLPELGDSSLIKGNAPADTKRLVKNVFDAYGVGKQGSFANSVGESVRLVEVCINDHHKRLESVGHKERLEASTRAELTVSRGASRLTICDPHPPHALGHCRNAQWCRNLTRRMHCLLDRHVRRLAPSWTMTDIKIYISAVAVAPLLSRLAMSRERMDSG